MARNVFHRGEARWSLRYSFQDSGEGLSATVELQHGFAACLLFATICGVTTSGLVIATLKVASTWAVAGGCFAALISYYQKSLKKKVKLVATNVEFITIGRFSGGGIVSRRAVPYVDVRWLEYRDETAGDVAYSPQGLYAVLKSGSACLLPYLDEQRTLELISKIEKKLPAFSQQWKRQTQFDQHYITLSV